MKFKARSSAVRNIILNCGHMLPELRSIMHSYYHLQPIIQKPHLWTNGKITNDIKETKFTKGNDHDKNIYKNMPTFQIKALTPVGTYIQGYKDELPLFMLRTLGKQKTS